MNSNYRKWTTEEDEVLIRKVKEHPQNLTRCFISVSLSIDRTPSAVAYHWYAVVSKRPNSTCFFTASPKHISRNRKNSNGTACNRNIWQRLLALIRGI